jgi:hypothetical protein
MSNKKSFFVTLSVFAALGLYCANDAFATCVRVLNSSGKLLGCAVLEAYPPDIKQCYCYTATMTFTTNLAHHQVLIRVGDQKPLGVSLGQERANGYWRVTPGVSGGTNAVAIFTMENQVCSGWDVGPDLAGGLCPTGGTNKKDVLDCESSWVSRGSGQCDYSVRYEIPVVTGDVVNQICSASPNSTKERPKSLLTYKAFCRKEIPVAGRGLGYVKWREGQGAPAQFTNCTEYLVNPISLEQTTISNDVCILQVGGFPIDPSTGVLDPNLCAQVFPPVDVNGDSSKHLASRQVLFLQQEWLGQCPKGGREPPTADQTMVCGPGGADPLGTNCLSSYPRVVQAYGRECNADLGGGMPGKAAPKKPFVWASRGGPADFRLQFGEGDFGDGFDNGSRVCPPHVTVAGVEAPPTVGTAVITNLNEPMTTAPPSQAVDLECDKGGNKDQSEVWVGICGTPDLNVKDIKLDAEVAPALEGGQRAHDFKFVSETAGPCAGGGQDLQLKYYTCTAAKTGLAQVIWGKAGAGGCTHKPLRDHDTCPVGLQAERKTNPIAPGVPVVLEDVMNVEVNNVKAIP